MSAISGIRSPLAKISVKKKNQQILRAAGPFDRQMPSMDWAAFFQQNYSTGYNIADRSEFFTKMIIFIYNVLILSPLFVFLSPKRAL